MKPVIKIVSFILLAGVLLYLSCKKEYSCEGCRDDNKPPIANAGPDQVITLPTDSVSLDGNASSDPDGAISSYLWTKISGPSLFNIANSNATQTQVINLVQGVYQFELKVTDAGGLFSKDTVQITVNSEPLPPPSSCVPITRPLMPAQLIPIGTLSKARSGFAIAAAGNKILFTGADSYTSTTSTSKVDIYDIGTGGWTTFQLSQARVDMGVAVLGNKIYIAGGLIPIKLPSGSWGFDGTASSAIDIYDASANTWTVDQLSSPRSPMGASVNNKILFAGGGNYNWPSQAADIYNATTNSWSTAMLSDSRRVPAVTTVGNKIFFAGGDRNADGFTSNIDIYDAVSNTWTLDHFNPPFDQGWAPTGIAVGNKNYWAGGWYYSPATYVQPTDQVVIRDESTHTSTYACLFQPNSHFDAVVKNNKIVFFTGWGSAKNKFDIYDITTDTWSIGVLNQDIAGAAIISVNNTIYVAGGSVNGVLSNQVWKLEF
jgi:hypothetical protein